MNKETRCSFCGRSEEEIQKISKKAKLIKGQEVKGVVSHICFLCVAELKHKES